jgi:pimeloyl-ACP methyl ester carboxylesterase
MFNKRLNRLKQPYPLSGILFLIAACSFSTMLFFWPIFDADFWVELAIFITSLVASLGFLTFALLKTPHWPVKAIAILPVALQLGLLGGVAWNASTLIGDGASIHSFSALEDSIEPRGRTIDLAYMKLSSQAATPSYPIVYLAGGPGGTGTLTMYLSGRYEIFQALRGIGDVIVYDQRGTLPWAGDWLACRETWSAPLEFSAEAFIKEKGQQLGKCSALYREDGINPAAYNTLNNAADIEALRRDLGVEKIILWGTSYGTHLAQTYLKRYPNNVSKMILHGTEGLDDTLKTPYQIQAALEMVAERAAADPNISAKMPDMLASVEHLLALAEQGKLRIPYTDDQSADDPLEKELVIGKFEMQFFLSQLLGSANSAMSLPARIYAASQGDMKSFEGWAWHLRGEKREMLMPAYMDCASYASEQRLALIERQAPETLLGDAINFPFPQICASIDYRDLGNGFRENVSSDVPVLFISGDFDARTPISNAVAAAQNLSNAQHLIIHGAGHGNELFLASEKILQNMFEFLKTGTTLDNNLEVERSFEDIYSYINQSLNN